MQNTRNLALLLCLMAYPAVAAPFDGPYVGVQGGYDSYHQSGRFEGAIGATTVNGFSATGGGYGIFAGYGKAYDGFYLGAELEGSINDAGFHFADDSGDSLGVSSKYTYGADLRAGYLPSDNVMLYASIGEVRSRFDTKTGVSSGSKDLNGARFGLGVETMVSPQVIARLGWSYTAYGDFHYQDSATALHLTPDESLVRIGVAYQF